MLLLYTVYGYLNNVLCEPTPELMRTFPAHLWFLLGTRGCTLSLQFFFGIFEDPYHDIDAQFNS